jgi:hypothetical protein
MNRDNKRKKVKILWDDAVLFSPKRKDISLSRMETIGVIETEDANYFLIKDPITINVLTKQKHPEKTPTYYLIPRGMIKSVDFIP